MNCKLHFFTQILSKLSVIWNKIKHDVWCYFVAKLGLIFNSFPNNLFCIFFNSKYMFGVKFAIIKLAVWTLELRLCKNCIFCTNTNAGHIFGNGCIPNFIGLRPIFIQVLSKSLESFYVNSLKPICWFFFFKIGLIFKPFQNNFFRPY